MDAAAATELVDVLRALVRDARARDRAAATGLTRVPEPVVTLLSHVDALGDGARVSTVAGVSGVGVPTASRSAASAEALGLVARSVDPVDGRAHRLALTDAGRQVLAEHRGARVAELRSALDDWSTDDVQLLLALLHRLRDVTGGRTRALAASAS